MKTISWEIILAGFFFVGIGIYLIESHSNTQTDKINTAISIDLEKNLNMKELKGIDLKQLKELEKLSELKDLEKLESLKSLSTFLPAEVQADFETEINALIKELEQEDINVNFSTDKQTKAVTKKLENPSNKWTIVSPGVYTFYQEFDASQLNTAEIELPFGSINIVGTADKKASFRIQASGQIDNKADLESKIKTTAFVQNEKGVFSVISSDSSENNQNVHLQATLSIPKNSEMKALTKAGHITSENIQRKQSYHTFGGHIKLKNVDGQVEAKSNGGHITVDEASGNLNLHTLGGHILINDSKGQITMRTSGGNLKAMDIDGSIQASTNGGNIELSFLKVDGNTNAETGAGTITIWVPKSVKTGFNLMGNSVEIDKALHFVGQQSEGSTKGQIGNSTAFIEAKTNYGQVILKASK